MFQSERKFIKHRKALGTLRRFEDGPGGLKLSSVLVRVFENRSVSSVEELRYPLAGLYKPDALKGGGAAVELLYRALQNNKSILIVGDYDTDGATSVALAILALRKMGCSSVSYLVPNRFEHGYGLSPEIAEMALQREPDIVITVDNGISSIEGVSRLKKNGITVIITDHHLPGKDLPDADAIVNPNQAGCPFPGKATAGVGVMFYLLLLLRSKLNAVKWFDRNHIAYPSLAEFLDLVALGTIADMVPLDYNNRNLVANGIGRIRKGQCRPGILALLEAGRKNYHDIVSSDIGFVIAPRLNAAGRLDDISTGIECLLAADRLSAGRYACQLDEINRQRKEIESSMQSKATGIVKRIFTDRARGGNAGAVDRFGFCLYDGEWHQGVTGLVASRIKEKTDQPVIAFAKTETGRLTGSARSISGLHIKDVLESISSENAGLIDKFGGHALAAGVTISENNLDRFSAEFYKKVGEFAENRQLSNSIETDGELDRNEISLSNAKLIRHAAPWGPGFPAPEFDGLFYVPACRIVGEIHLHMMLQSVDGSSQYEGIAFRALERGQPAPELETIRAVYRMDVNHYGGKEKLQLIIEYFEMV